MISASIPDSYFLSETDKLNFYREIELVQDFEDLEYLKNSFFENTQISEISTETQNLFTLLKTQILAKKYKITLIKKAGINYQVEFHQQMSLDELK
jgi:transcription-repair coupling factor (superfamily II helicase)